jgi:hypothetical protein
MEMLQSILLFYVCFSFSPSAGTVVHLDRLRPVDPVARRLLAVGHTRSTFFRSLVERIQRSDLIVYICTEPVLLPGVDGRLQFAVSVPNARYLRVTVRDTLAPDQLVAILGHELMHAVEVADAHEARDRQGFRQLYARIGHSHDGVAFDTTAAVDAGHRVFAELRIWSMLGRGAAQH